MPPFCVPCNVSLRVTLFLNITFLSFSLQHNTVGDEKKWKLHNVSAKPIITDCVQCMCVLRSDISHRIRFNHAQNFSQCAMYSVSRILSTPVLSTFSIVLYVVTEGHSRISMYTC